MSELLWASNPLALWRHFSRHSFLIRRLARREVEQRYRGAWLGAVWMLLTPLLMLAVYTFVFSVVFRARWGSMVAGSRADFALALFAGLTAFGVFADTVSGSPTLVTSNPNYVKRVVFPLEVLPVAQFLANLVQAGLGLLVFVAVALVLRGAVPWTLVLLPVALVPLSLLTLGCSFFLAAVGAFLRDIQHVVRLAVQMLLFMSAVFYPPSAVPESLRRVLLVNPLVPIIDNVRRVALEGKMPDWSAWWITTACAAVLLVAGLTFFMKSKRAFADVL